MHSWASYRVTVLKRKSEVTPGQVASPKDLINDFEAVYRGDFTPDKVAAVAAS
jgi:hypothetical protein